jgi:N-acetyl-gamma-glutamyl-phosphate reductase
MPHKPRIFIDGSAGTTGLRIRERLSGRDDLELLEIPGELRKDLGARSERINSADVVFLCLPDAAALEAAALLQNPDTVIIDTSTAHRTAPGWTYGFPELEGRRELIAASRRIANPGCHASGFIALVEPLVRRGLIPPGALLDCFSLTGYSGGGKKMIADYEDPGRAGELRAPRLYGLTQTHKHLPEMKAVCGLENAPVFLPVVSSYYAGMEVTVPLRRADTGAGAEEIAAVYREYYAKGLVRYADGTDEGGFLSAGKFSGRDDMELSVWGDGDRVLAVARFDNLGKGASGSAIQNMNIVLGLPEDTGLTVG